MVITNISTRDDHTRIRIDSVEHLNWTPKWIKDSIDLVHYAKV